MFHVSIPDVRVDWLLREFRLMVNQAVRFGLQNGFTSRGAIRKGVYRAFREEHRVYAQYIPSACEVAASLLKNYRRRVRKGLRTKIPIVRKLFLTAENQSFKLDRKAGMLRFPIRAGEYVEVALPVGEFHRRFLDDETLSIGSLTLARERVIIVLRKEVPATFEPRGVIALDTNESSLDGIFASDRDSVLVQAPFPSVREIQAIHFRRRRRLAKKKAHDRRTRGRLLAREGVREHNRVKQRLHLVSNAVLRAALEHKSAIALENLTLHGSRSSSRRLNRRLSSWPRSELHRQIEYKAEWTGVPLIKVDPRYTSRTCPACGWIEKSRRRATRANAMFSCNGCGWRLDRQFNAGLNILRTATASCEAAARAVRFRPGALRHDVVNLLYRPAREAREEPNAESMIAGGKMPESSPSLDQAELQKSFVPAEGRPF